MSIKPLFKVYKLVTKLSFKITKYTKNYSSYTFSSLIASLLVSGTIIGIRQLGGLQFLELLAYDLMVRVTSTNYRDPRLLLVEITEQDIKNQNQWPISDRTIAQLLQKLHQHQPKVIGLDIYRDIASPPGTEELQKQLQKTNTIVIEHLGSGNNRIAAPSNVPESRIGFNDLVLDFDDVLRRYIVYAQIGKQQFYSFSLRLSLAYFKDNPLVKKKGWKNASDFKVTPNGVYIGNIFLKPLGANSGGYRMPPQEAAGLQTIIKYQSHDIAQRVTLTEVLAGKIDPNLVKDKVVIIGTTAPSIKDLFSTPYDGQKTTMPGAVIHAQMVSQILSLVLDDKTQVWFWTEAIEGLWIVIWAGVGAAIAWRLRHPLALAGVGILCLGILWGIGFSLFLGAGWIPVIPPTLSFILTGSGIVAYKAIYAMFYDSLTDLPNLTRFTDKLNKLKVKRFKNQENSSISVFCLDIDRFKLINEGLGYKAGDHLLKCTAKSLRRYFNSGALIARVGGDEFAVAVLNLPDAQAAVKIADQLQQDLTLSFLLQGRQATTTLTVGVAFNSVEISAEPRHGVLNFQGENMLRAAQTAMYKAKAEGKTHSEVFSNTMHEQALSRLQLEADLYEAVENQEFELYYQPIISLKTGKMAGFEALVRWQSPKRGFVSPGAFIPAAEETGTIIPLGEWILQEACHQMYQWQQEFSDYASLFVSVNLSGRQFGQKDLVDTIQHILALTNLAPQSLKLEITESMVMDNVESAIAMLENLKILGMKLSMDDFGTGFSSFSYLHRFPIDTLKVDRSFVSNMSQAAKNIEIVSTIVMLAHKLGMDVVAEGIETLEEKELLKALNCEYGQGYLFSKPISTAAVSQLLRESGQW
ncbi:MAG: EAL domain-containing protein [Xenococcaceae cyanobacterium MO_234.B1]|nr:EAL domain-containing protein [Xenococcaceae cyanobacterium MO_234.B1]